MAKRTKPTPNTTAKGEVVRSRTEENLDVLVGQLESALPQQFSDKHIDRYFDTQEKLYSYVREDHKDQKDLVKDGRKTVVILAITFGLLLLLLLLIIAITDKQEIDKFLSLFFAFLGGTGVGGGGGFVIGKHSSGKNSND